jgi:hypothetical protein
MALVGCIGVFILIKMKNLIIFLFIINHQINLSAQLYDANCVSGQPFYAGDSSKFGAYTTNYLSNWPINKFTRLDKYFDRGITISSNTGKLLFYSNGVVINNDRNIKIAGGDSLSPGFWTDMQVADNAPYPFSHFFALPIANSDSNFLFFHPFEPSPDSTIFSGSGSPERYYFSQVDMRLNQGLGKVTNKNQLLVRDSANFVNALMATKHANGRDWWIIVPEMNRVGYHTFLMTLQGIKSKGLNIFSDDTIPIFNCSYCAKTFSPNGETYIDYNQNKQLSIFDFDRCTGALSNYRPIILTSFGFNPAPSGGLAFSPNGRFFYITMLRKVIQFDLQASDILASAVVVIQDYLQNEASSYRINTAIDGRIYMQWGNSFGNSYMRYIAFPNEKGMACMTPNNKLISFGKFVHGITSPYPNYRLGPIDGSQCDSLGIDNFPLARFRWDISDTSGRIIRFTDNSSYNPETWQWDFGDGFSSNEMNPFHTYQQDGVYPVCEIVCNTIGCDTFCTDVFIGVSATDNFREIEEAIIFPNPANDNIQLLLQSFSGSETFQFQITNTLGQVIKRETFIGGGLEISVADLPAGIVFVQVFDRGKVKAVGKLVIVR